MLRPPSLPRLITHRPDLLRVEEWGWTDGPWSQRLAAWLDVAYAGHDDWHAPALVLIDVECLGIMTALYGQRTGVTIAVGEGDRPADREVIRMLDAARAGLVDAWIPVHAPTTVRALTDHLRRYRTTEAGLVLAELRSPARRPVTTRSLSLVTGQPTPQPLPC